MISKFRIWNMHENMMVTDDQIIIWNGNVYINEARKLSPKKLTGWSVDDKYLMQSTGLKDKNGAEIFEGDVVKCCHFKNDFLSEYIGQVNFVDFGWHVVDHKGTYDPFYNYRDKFHDEIFEIEVLGNVWENPELLEVPHDQ